MGKVKNWAKHVTLPPGPKTCGGLLLDSGAHSLYEEHARGRADSVKYAFYDTDEFQTYLDRYAAFVKANKHKLDFYVNLDVIFHPQKSWDALKYLEDEHGLSPMPVVHHLTPIRWVEKYLNAGYTYLGIGGVGQKVGRGDYPTWANKVYEVICPGPSYLPTVKTHGFALTSAEFMAMWPWYSVDSASWCQLAGYGQIFVPYKVNGRFDVGRKPYQIFTDPESSWREKKNRHLFNLPKLARRQVEEWLEVIGVPVGDPESETPVWGVTTSYGARAVANMKYFDLLAKSIPKWPWPFYPRSRKGLFK